MSSDPDTLAAPASPVGTPRAARRRPAMFRIGGGIPTAPYIAIAVGMFALLLVAWCVATYGGLVDPLFLPAPGDVLGRLRDLASDGTLWADVRASVTRIVIGFALATVMAVPLGVLMGAFGAGDAALTPPIEFMRYIPPAAITSLGILWVGFDETFKWFVIWFGTFFFEALLIMDVVRRVQMELVDIGRTLGHGELSILRRIVLPAAAPGIWDACRAMLGWAWSWLILAEVVGATNGFGYRINQARQFFDSETIFAYLLVLGLLGLAIDQALRFAGRRLFAWAAQGR